MKKIFTSFLVATICLGTPLSLVAQVNVQDSLALVDLYNSTNGPNWYTHTNWLTGEPVSKWTGITVKNSRVTFIFLGGNQLSGSIPSSIGNLGKLGVLELNNNKLTGSIPFSIGNLLNVYWLDLSYNQLSGAIPSSIGSVGNGTLYLLDLSSNKLTGNIPASMGNLGSWLAYLLLRNNRLSGDIPPSLSNVGVDQIVGPGGETGLMTIDSNYLTFGGMEFLVQRIHAVDYNHQKNIPVTQNGNTLSVSAGGTLSNNTYKLLKWNGPSNYTLVATNYGDSVFHPTESGIYQVKILNLVATGLVLYSKVIHYVTPANPVIASTENELQQYNNANFFHVYPNPANDVLHVETNGGTTFSLINQLGKILVTTNINGKGSINVSGITPGLYYLRNNTSNEVQKVIISR